MNPARTHELCQFCHPPKRHVGCHATCPEGKRLEAEMLARSARNTAISDAYYRRDPKSARRASWRKSDRKRLAGINGVPAKVDSDAEPIRAETDRRQSDG